MTISKIRQIPMLSIDILDEYAPGGQCAYELLLDNDNVFTMNDGECLEGALIALWDDGKPIALLSHNVWKAGPAELARNMRYRACQERCDLEEFNRWTSFATYVAQMPPEDWYCVGCVDY